MSLHLQQHRLVPTDTGTHYSGALSESHNHN